MKDQRTFFDDEHAADMESKRLARRSDPESSKLAAKEDRHGLYALALHLLRERPGQTGRELNQSSGRELHKRLKTLERMGLVTKSEDLRPCSVSGRLAHTWFAKE